MVSPSGHCGLAYSSSVRISLISPKVRRIIMSKMLRFSSVLGPPRAKAKHLPLRCVFLHFMGWQQRKKRHLH
jgi:hypothetical protein